MHKIEIFKSYWSCLTKRIFAGPNFWEISVVQCGFNTRVKSLRNPWWFNNRISHTYKIQMSGASLRPPKNHREAWTIILAIILVLLPVWALNSNTFLCGHLIQIKFCKELQARSGSVDATWVSDSKSDSVHDPTRFLPHLLLHPVPSISPSSGTEITFH